MNSATASTASLTKVNALADSAFNEGTEKFAELAMELRNLTEYTTRAIDAKSPAVRSKYLSMANAVRVRIQSASALTEAMRLTGIAHDLSR